MKRVGRGHPFVFVVAVFMAVGAFGVGQVGWGLLWLAVAVVLVRWRRP